MTYGSRDEIEQVVRGFESCTTGKDGFPHRAHLATAVWYLHDSDPESATNKMRASLERFLNHHDCREHYHETMTVFWIKLVHEVLMSLPPQQSLLEQTNAVVERLNDSKIVFEYYTKSLVGSDKAKRTWVEPDLKKLGSESAK